MANVFDIANFFIDMANRTGEDCMTNMRINKLLYFAQGGYLARYGIPLFDDEFEAWQYGPVVKKIYDKYKVCKKNAVDFVDDEYENDNLDEQEINFLIDVMREYGIYTTSALVDISHKEDSPWGRAGYEGATIPTAQIGEYFSKPENQIKAFADRLSASKISTVNKLPKEWYDPAEDEEWETYLND